MVSNIYKERAGLTDEDATKNLILGFNGQLKGWWDNTINEEAKTQFFQVLKEIQKEILLITMKEDPYLMQYLL